MTQEEKLAILNAKEVEVFEAVRDTGAKDEALPRLLRAAWDVHMLTECLEDDEPYKPTETEVEPQKEPPKLSLDGKTADGAVPYQILMNQLEFLK